MRSRQPTRVCVAILAGIVALVVLGGGGASGAVRAPNATCGQLVTADLTLNNDLVGCPGDGLDVQGSHITLDLNGHMVSGSGSGTGIFLPDEIQGYITVENGKVSGFDRGVFTGLEPANHVTLRNLSISGNSSVGITIGSSANVVSDSWIAGNGGDGVHIYEFADSTAFQNNVIVGNAGNGVFGSNAITQLTGNVVNNNGLNGISMFEEFGDSFASIYLFARNVSYANNGLGISACNSVFGVGSCELGMVDGGGNAAWDNADSRQCVNIVCARAAATSLLGTTQIKPGVDSNQAGQAEAFADKADADGTVTHLALYVDSGSTATNLVAGIYASTSNNSHPGTLLAKSVLPDHPIAGVWNTVTLPAVQLAAGTRYWIAILAPQGAGTIRFRDQCCGYSGSKPTETSAQTNLTTLPPTWAKGTRYRDDGPVSGWAG